MYPQDMTNAHQPWKDSPVHRNHVTGSGYDFKFRSMVFTKNHSLSRQEFCGLLFPEFKAKNHFHQNHLRTERQPSSNFSLIFHSSSEIKLNIRLKSTCQTETVKSDSLYVSFSLRF